MKEDTYCDQDLPFKKYSAFFLDHDWTLEILAENKLILLWIKSSFKTNFLKLFLLL